MSKKEIALYPNPTQGSFHIDLIEESDINIYNLLGQNVMHLDKVSGSQQIHIENAPKGLYFVRIQNGNQIEVKKLILE